MFVEIEDETNKEKELNKKVTDNLKVLAEMRGLPFADTPTQRLHYKKILKLGFTHTQIAQQLEKCIQSDYWVQAD